MTAVIIEAVAKLINTAGFLIPGNVGASEGGNMLLLAALSLGGSNGLVLALARRLRALFWAVIGLALLYLQGLQPREKACLQSLSPPTPGGIQ